MTRKIHCRVIKSVPLGGLWSESDSANNSGGSDWQIERACTENPVFQLRTGTAACGLFVDFYA